MKKKTQKLNEKQVNILQQEERALNYKVIEKFNIFKNLYPPK